MASTNSVHRLRRSVSTTFAGVPPMFRRILRRRNSSNPTQGATSLMGTESSQAQFDKRCVVTFESGRGTIRAVRHSFVPEAEAPDARPEQLHQQESPAASLAEIRTLTPEPSEGPELAEYRRQSQLLHDLQQASEDLELKQRLLELSQKMDLILEKLDEGFGRMEAQLNMLQAHMQAQQQHHGHGHSHRHRQH